MRLDLARALETLPGLTVSKHIVPNPHPPHAMIGRGVIRYNQNIQATRVASDWTVRLVVGRAATDADAMDAMDAWVEPTGIPAAIQTYASTAWEGRAVVSEADAGGTINIGGVDYLVVDFLVLVIAITGDTA